MFWYLPTVASDDFSVVYIRATTILSSLTAVIDKSKQITSAEGSVSKLANNGNIARFPNRYYELIQWVMHDFLYTSVHNMVCPCLIL